MPKYQPWPKKFQPGPLMTSKEFVFLTLPEISDRTCNGCHTKYRNVESKKKCEEMHKNPPIGSMRWKRGKHKPK